MEDIQSKCEAFDDSSILLLEEDCVKDESVALSNQPSGGTVGQHPELGPLSSTQNETLREERIEVRVNHNTLFPENGTRIFEVVARGDHEALSDFLITDTTSVCAIDKEGNTALHRAVASACQEGNKDESFYQCIDLLLTCEQTNVNKPNKNGYTAIGLATHKLHKTCVEHILKHSSANRLYLDYYPADSESTVREFIMQRCPELQSLLPPPLMEGLDSSERDIKLLAALQRGEYEVFLKYLSQTNINPWYDEPYHSSLLEIACQVKKRYKFVKLLLHNGADPNTKNRVTGMPLIHATARSGNFQVLKLLLTQGKADASITDNKNRTILHWLARVSGKNPDDKKRLNSCFKLVLDSCGNKIIDWIDDEGNTALYVAVKSEYQDRVLLLLKRGADIMLPIHGTPMLSSVSTPMLEAILDDCLECNGEPETSEDLKLTFNYEILYKIVPHMAECPHQRAVLKHPVTSCFINMHYVYISVYIVLSIIMYLIQLFTLMYANLYPGHIPLFVLITMWVAAVTCDLLFYSCFNHIKALRNFKFILSLPMITHIVGMCFDVLKNSWIWPHMLVISFLLAWLKLVVMTGRLPLVAVQMEMFIRVRFTFLKYMAGYSFVLITFAVTIFITFKGSLKRIDIGELYVSFHSLLKTSFMYTGEIEFPNTNFVTLTFISQMILSLFFLMANYILLKLLYGLAVLDAKELRMDPEMLSLVKKVRILIDYKTYRMSRKILRSNEMKEGNFSVYPHRWKSLSHRLFVVIEIALTFHFVKKIEVSKLRFLNQLTRMAMEKKFNTRKT